MKKFKLNKEFHYTEIIEKESGIIIISEYGEELIGEHFIVLKNISNNNVVSFLMVRYGNGAYYKCIYNDWIN